MSDRDPHQQKPFHSNKPGDRPANASELEQVEIPLERERNSVRREQEGLRDRKMRRRVLLLVVGLAAIATSASAAVIAVALAHGDYARVAPLVPVVAGSGWLGFFAWSRFSETIKDQASAESEPPE